LRPGRVFLLAVLLTGCAQPERAPEAPAREPAIAPLPALPASFESVPPCPACAAVTLTLRKDGGFLLRERVGNTEFSDFGRWTLAADGTLTLQGERERRRYAPRTNGALDDLDGGGPLLPKAAITPIRGPFRMIGLYDGTTFKDCRTGISWPVDDSRAGGSLREDYRRSAPGLAGRPALVSIDARFDEEDPAREEVHIQRIPAILSATACPAPQ
jgi:hypothetical protein